MTKLVDLLEGSCKRFLDRVVGQVWVVEKSTGSVVGQAVVASDQLFERRQGWLTVCIR